jgi:hypothetical protein
MAGQKKTTGSKKLAAPRGRGADEAEKRTPTVIRFPPDMLKRIDEAAKQRGVSRAAWVLMVSSRALDRDDW